MMNERVKSIEVSEKRRFEVSEKKRFTADTLVLY